MAGYEAKYCARCNGTFECKPGNITQCQCFGITFTEEEKNYVRATYDDCLCRNCLLHIKHEVRHDAVKSKLKSILSIFK